VEVVSPTFGKFHSNQLGWKAGPKAGFYLHSFQKFSSLQEVWPYCSCSSGEKSPSTWAISVVKARMIFHKRLKHIHFLHNKEFKLIIHFIRFALWLNIQFTWIAKVTNVSNPETFKSRPSIAYIVTSGRRRKRWVSLVAAAGKPVCIFRRPTGRMGSVISVFPGFSRLFRNFSSKFVFQTELD